MSGAVGGFGLYTGFDEYLKPLKIPEWLKSEKFSGEEGTPLYVTVEKSNGGTKVETVLFLNKVYNNKGPWGRELAGFQCKEVEPLSSIKADNASNMEHKVVNYVLSDHYEEFPAFKKLPKLALKVEEVGDVEISDL